MFVVGPGNLIYTAPLMSYTIDVSIVPNGPVAAPGLGLTYSVTPPLPLGLTLDTSTGNITGVPTQLSPQTAYTITANNTGGNTSAVLLIAVVEGRICSRPPSCTCFS